MTLNEAIEYYTKVATDRELADEEKGDHDKWTETIFMTKKQSAQMIADNRQLVEWLMEYKDLKAEQNDQYVFIHELISELKEAKRLLKAAMKDMKVLYETGKDEGCIGIEFKWRYADEALKLMGDEPNGI